MKKLIILLLLFIPICCFSEEYETLYDKEYYSVLSPIEEHISLYEEPEGSNYLFSLWTDTYDSSLNFSKQYRVFSNNKEILMKLLLTLEENRIGTTYHKQFTYNILKSGNYKLFDEKILTVDNVIYQRFYYEVNEK